MAVNDIILCTPDTPNDVKLYDPAVGCGGSVAWTLNLSDTITLSDAIVKGVGKFFADNITLSDQLSGITPQGGRIRTYRFFWLKIYVCTLEGRNVFRITIFD